MKNLCNDVTVEKVKELFSTFGEIASCAL